MLKSRFPINGEVRQYFAGFACSLSLAVLGSSAVWSSPVIPKLMKEDSQVHLTNTELSWVVSSLYIGMLFSPIPGGYLMDYFGRKKVLLWSSFIPLISWIVIYFATEPYQLYITRALCGFANGISYTIVPVYVGEIAEPDIRASIGNFMTILVNGGAMMELVIGPYISYRQLIVMTAIIPVVFMMAFARMPETPYFYIMKNRTDKAMESLVWLRKNKNENEIISEMIVIETSTKQQMESKSGYKDLIREKGNRKACIIIQCLGFFQRLSGITALLTFASITIPKNSVSWLSLNQCVSILGIAWFITTLSSTFILERFKRKTLFIVSSMGCGVCTLIVAIWYYLEEKTDTIYTDQVRWLPFILFIIHAVFYAIGIGPLAMSIRGELYPANLKGKGSAINSIVLGMSSFLVAKSFLIINDDYGMYLNYLIFSVNCFTAALFTYVYVIETKGKSLKQIQDELNNR